jgi:hypothetical protein
MKPRTKWTIAAVLALAVVALIVDPRLLLTIPPALAAIWAAARQAAKAIGEILKAERGTVEGDGDIFAKVPGAPGLLDVWAASEDPAAARRVGLPEGIVAAQVRAVRIVPGGAAVVEVLP